jgi:hypothetical protein
MRHITAFVALLALSACGGPTLQSDIFAKSTPDMEQVESECANKTAHNKDMHVAAVKCRFDAYEVILGERGFQEYNDLDTLKKHFVDIAKQQDAHKITEEKALVLSEKYTQDFSTNLQKHDQVKSQYADLQNRLIQQDIQMIAYGLGVGLQAYSAAHYPAGSPMPQASCPACEQGANAGQANAQAWGSQQPSSVQINNSLMDSYVKESQQPNPYWGVGSPGGDGRKYVPVIDPNPPPNVVGGQTLGVP